MTLATFGLGGQEVAPTVVAGGDDGRAHDAAAAGAVPASAFAILPTALT